jgi:hypothetical protein
MMTEQETMVKKYWLKDSTPRLQKYSIQYTSRKTWNRLPEDVVNSKTVNTFQDRLDKYWIEHLQVSEYSLLHRNPVK